MRTVTVYDDQSAAYDAAEVAQAEGKPATVTRLKDERWEVTIGRGDITPTGRVADPDLKA
jgi:hypothetical protein